MKKILAIVLALVLVLAFCACGDKTEETTAAPVADGETPVAPAEGGEASGEPSDEGGVMNNQNGSFDITVDGVSGTAEYEDVDSGDQTTKSFVITWQGNSIEGSIDKGQWVAADSQYQNVVDAVHEAFENNDAGSGEPSEEPAA